MYLDKNYLSKFKVSNSSEEKELCREIYEHFKPEFNFGMLVVMCRRNGNQAIREIFEEVKKSDSSEPARLFLYLVKKYGTKFEN